MQSIEFLDATDAKDKILACHYSLLEQLPMSTNTPCHRYTVSSGALNKEPLCVQLHNATDQDDVCMCWIKTTHITTFLPLSSS